MSSNLAAVTMSSSSIIADIKNLVYTSDTDDDDDEFDAAGKGRRVNIISAGTNDRHLVSGMKVEGARTRIGTRVRGWAA
jgi:hypothetical protein